MIAGRSKDYPDIAALAEKLGILKQDDVIALLAQYVPKDDIPDDVLEEIKLRFEP